MKCEICGRDMFKLVDPRVGKVTAYCPVCKVEKKEEELVPPFYENKEAYEKDEV